MSKSKNQISMANKLSMRIQEMRTTPVEQLTGSEVIQSVIGAMPVKPQQVSIVLYLREGLNGAERNFTKYPNEIHELIKSRLKEMSEGILYMYLWWMSWGFGKNYCRVGYGKIVSKTLIGCIKTAQRAIETLVEKKFIIRGLTDKDKPDVNTKGALYRILTPKEIIEGKTDEGVPLADIPISGVVMEYSNQDYGNNDHSNKVYGNQGYSNKHHSNNDHSTMDLKTMDSITILNEKQDGTMVSGDSGNQDHSNKVHPFKDIFKDNLKDSLSPRETVMLFYRGINQEKISKQKRERAEANIEKLQEEGFTLEDIQFAVKWTLENAKEEPYDFSIINHTIGQAIAAKQQEKAKEAKRLEIEQDKIRKTEQEKEANEYREKIKSYKDKLSTEQKSELRVQALDKIRHTKGIKEEFITEILIEAKENELIAKTLGIDLSETAS